MKMETVLLVEDDVPFRARLAGALLKRGMTVIEAGNPAEAKTLAAKKSFDGAVIDMRMPGGSGLDVVRELRSQHPAARLIVLTGYGSIATALEAVRLGAADYVMKPADADQVLAALRGERLPNENPKDFPPETPTLNRVEWEHIQRVLADCNGNISQAARMLGLDRRSLQRKLAKYPPHR
jgi:two-component system response regulator RegA